ncbi:MAG: hypothetical protein Q3977_05180, partial [Oscillospiraceae bacterium]|nr:hypothetical protein [Oscillospiraceae bacterium]
MPDFMMRLKQRVWERRNRCQHWFVSVLEPSLQLFRVGGDPFIAFFNRFSRKFCNGKVNEKSELCKALLDIVPQKGYIER